MLNTCGNFTYFFCLHFSHNAGRIFLQNSNVALMTNRFGHFLVILLSRWHNRASFPSEITNVIFFLSKLHFCPDNVYPITQFGILEIFLCNHDSFFMFFFLIFHLFSIKNNTSLAQNLFQLLFATRLHFFSAILQKIILNFDEQTFF